MSTRMWTILGGGAFMALVLAACSSKGDSGTGGQAPAGPSGTSCEALASRERTCCASLGDPGTIATCMVVADTIAGLGTDSFAVCEDQLKAFSCGGYGTACQALASAERACCASFGDPAAMGVCNDAADAIAGLGDSSFAACIDQLKTFTCGGGSCTSEGDYCDLDDDCCGGVCSNNVCDAGVVACFDEGSDCNIDNDCCEGLCTSDDICDAGGTFLCRDEGAACDFDDECCYGVCSGGVCDAGTFTCYDEGSTCEWDDECCGGVCTGGVCDAGGGGGCLDTGALCNFDDDCCSSFCDTDGHCG